MSGLLTRLLALCLLLTFWVGCSEPGPETKVAPPALLAPANGGLPPLIDEMLSGSEQSCQADKECPAQVCYYGRCLGLLLVDQRWSQERIVATLKQTMAERGNTEIRNRLEMRLGAFMVRQEGDVVAWQARSLLALEALEMTDTIAASLKHVRDERVRAAAAIALTRLGDPRGLPLTTALTEGEQTHVAIEALLALGKSSPSDEALTALLASLSEDVDRMVARAAIIGLGELGDKRAIGPLVDFLEDGPSHLRYRVVGVLRRLTDAKLGADPALWRVWVTDNAPPAAPAFKKRVVDDEVDFGMPDF